MSGEPPVNPTDPAGTASPAPAPAAPVEPSAPPVLPSSAARLADKPALNAMAGEDDVGWSRHLGLPFFFRHAMPATNARISFWLGMLIILLIAGLHLLLMPIKDSPLLVSLRKLLLLTGSQFISPQEGLQRLQDTYTIIALILGCIISPMLAVSSLVQERIAGTLEFLRLAPLSSTAIVLGKIFAPGQALLKFAALLLLLGAAAGIAGERSLDQECVAMLCIVCGITLLHGIAGLCSTLTLAMRGGAATSLFFFGAGLITTLPATTLREPLLSFCAHLSPFWAPVIYFWSPAIRGLEISSTWFGKSLLVPVFVLLTQGLLFFLLVHAAARKLEVPERPALPRPLWALAACWLIIVSIGAGMNSIHTVSPVGSVINLQGWDAAWKFCTLAGSLLLILALLDHPFHRDTLLTLECTRLQQRLSRPRLVWRGLTHACFILALALALAATILGMNRAAQTGRDLQPLMAILAVVTVLYFMFAVILEAVAVRFASFLIQGAFTLLIAGIFTTLVVLPAVRMLDAYGSWQLVAQYEEFKLRTKGLQVTRTSYQFNQILSSDGKLNEKFEPYYWEFDTLEDFEAHKKQYQDSPAAVYWHYHQGQALSYPLLFILSTFIVFWWRARNYRQLTEEVQKALSSA